MAIDYELLRLCDKIYMLEHWRESKGAINELNYAKQALRIPVMFEKYRDSDDY